MKMKRILSFSMVLAMFLSLFTGLVSETYVAEAAANGLVLHLTFDGDLKDSSGFSNHGKEGYGKITYEEGIYGNAAVFNGKSYVEVADSDTLDLDEFTISLWVYKQKNFDIDHHVPFVYKEEDDESYHSPYTLYERSDNIPQLEMHGSYDSDELNQYSLAGTSIDIRKWYLLTATFDGSEARIYENDELLIKESVRGGLAKTIGDLYIGMKEGYYSSDYFTGKMDDLRIYNRALSATEVSNLYNNGVLAKPQFFNIPKLLVAHYKFNGDVKDYSGLGNHAKVAAGKIQYVDGVNGKAAKFTKKAYLEVADSTTLDFDRGFTATGWINIGGDSNMSVIYKNGVSTSDNSNDLTFRMLVRDDFFEFDYVPFGNQSGQEHASYSTDSSVKNKWIHFAITFDGKEFRWYRNGKVAYKEKAPDNDGVDLSHATGSLLIGSDGSNFFNGSLDELQIYNYSLSSNQVASLYKQKDSLSISSNNQKAINGLKVKGTVDLAVTRTYYETKKSDKVTSGVTYKSSNNKIFTVSKTGKITAVKKGKATLTISHGGISKTYTVYVK